MILHATGKLCSTDLASNLVTQHDMLVAEVWLMCACEQELLLQHIFTALVCHCTLQMHAVHGNTHRLRVGSFAVRWRGRSVLALTQPMRDIQCTAPSTRSAGAHATALPGQRVLWHYAQSRCSPGLKSGQNCPVKMPAQPKRAAAAGSAHNQGQTVGGRLPPRTTTCPDHKPASHT